MKKCIVAGVLIFSEDGRKVLLVKHRKLGMWIYPGGHIEKSENPLECAIRESKEETGASFEILSTSDFTIDSVSAKSTPQPLVLMNELVPYSEGPHEHFDMIYLGKATSSEFKNNEESSDCKWIDEGEIEGLETFSNVKEIIKFGFTEFRRIEKW